jgi:hypothetical protein
VLRFGTLGLALALAMTAAGTAQATTYTFVDGTSASGSIDTTTGVVTLNDLITDPTSAASEISGLIINFSTTPGAIAVTNSVGQLITISNHVGSDVSGSITRWHTTESGSQVNLIALGGGQPSQLIIGGGTGTNSLSYGNANASIGNFLPSIFETGMFTLSGLAGLVVSSVEIEFGTGPDTTTGPLTPTVTPLPATLPLFAGGLGFIGYLAKRRKQNAKQAIAAA